VVFDVYACSDKGCVRGNNEDNLYIDGRVRENIDCHHLELHENFQKQRLIFAVCDGMGGEANGEFASLAAVKAIKYESESEIRQEAIDNINAANHAVKQEQARLRSRNTGTTIAAFTIEEGTGLAYNLGDSRVYLYRDNNLSQLSKDHTIADYLVELGVMTAEQAQNHPNKNSLTQFLGMDFDGILEPYFASPVQLRAGDTVLICSDGLYNMADNGALAAILARKDSVEETGKAMLNAALNAGGLDNISLILIKVTDKKEGKRFKGQKLFR